MEPEEQGESQKQKLIKKQLMDHRNELRWILTAAISKSFMQRSDKIRFPFSEDHSGYCLENVLGQV